MQPQDAGGGFDWGHALSAMGGGAITAIGAAIGWVYRAGARDPTLKAELQKNLIDAEKRVEAQIEAAKKETDGKVDSLVTQFHDTFASLRQKIGDVERNAVTKEEFNDHRKEVREDFRISRDENREDFAELKRNIAQILGDRA